jgi:hypothetical protein
MNAATRRYPPAVVVDTGPASVLTLDRDSCGVLFTPETAARYAHDLNQSRKPEHRSWRPFLLIPDAAQYLVEEFTQDGDAETVTRRFLEFAASPSGAFTAAATRGGGFLFAARELTELEPGYRWAASDGSSVSYEVRRLAES